MKITVITKKDPANNGWRVEVYRLVADLVFDTEIDANRAALLVWQSLRNLHDDDVERIRDDKKE